MANPTFGKRSAVYPDSRAGASGASPAHVVQLDASAEALLLIELIPDFREELKRAAELLRAAVGDAEIATALTRAAASVNAQGKRHKNEQAQVQNLLSRVASQLDEFNQYLTGQDADHMAARASETALSDRVMDEMQQIGRSVRTATDLEGLRGTVLARLDAVKEHFKDFCVREAARTEDYEKSIKRMRHHIGDLEIQTLGLRRSLAEEQEASVVDALTGLPNRAAYDHRIIEEFRSRENFGQSLCIAVWDIDRFKGINDTYGHLAGDRLLRAVAQTLARYKRAADFVARYGGEEFVMILPETTAHQASRLADRLREGIAGIGFRFRDQPVDVTISCGIARVEDKETPEQTFARADRALYEAKKNGRNCCVLA